MRRLMLLAGVAALSVSLPVLAKENEGRGKGGGHEMSDRGRGQGGARFAERGRGGDDRGQAERRGRGNDDRGAGRGRGHENAGRGNRDRGGEARQARAERQERRVERALRDERQFVREARQERRERSRDVRDARRESVRDRREIVREARRDNRRDWSDWAERRLGPSLRFREPLLHWRDARGQNPGVGRYGCPPGLARQNVYCMPPGQLRKARLIGQRLGFANAAYNIPDRYSYRFVDNDDWFYRYDDEGYVYRFDRDSGLVNSIVPLFGSDLLVGEPLPLGYDVYNVPLSYRPYYLDGPDSLYRYDDGAIYQVDPETRLIEGIVALLTGGVGGLGGLGIGDRLPIGYDAYNLPLDYRDQYVDSDDAWYRYADGAVYQVDPQTRLIEEVISLLV